MKLQDRTYIVTGGGGYLGREIVKGLIKEGAVVYSCNRSLPKENISNRKQISVQVDISNETDRQSLITEIRKKHRKLNGIINNAYSVKGRNEDDLFTDAYNITVTSVYRLFMEAKDLLIHGSLEGRGGASVVNICSMYGNVSPDYRIYEGANPINPPYYGAAKAGLIQLSRYLACLYGKDRIRVNSISPGPFPKRDTQILEPRFMELLSSRVPLGRIGLAEELSGPVVFLCSDDSSYITGANIMVDGGWTSW